MSKSDPFVSDNNACCTLNNIRTAIINFDITPGERLRKDITVESWQPLIVKANIWHPRLPWLEQLMDNKRRRNEADAFVSIACDYLSLVDNLVQEGVHSIMDQQERMQKRINKATSTVVIMSTILYFWVPWLGFAIDATGIIVMMVWYRLIMQRHRKLAALLEQRKQEKSARRRRYCIARFESSDVKYAG
ncbi:MAG: hypothetical protein HGB32_03585 [Geobacteraceae bacterium]|nr:hypothetical protein [Geobacteraceae bacterium]NTW79214.1 hypothetical protein [Geobacteraceae bacterium]